MSPERLQEVTATITLCGSGELLPLFNSWLYFTNFVQYNTVNPSYLTIDVFTFSCFSDRWLLKNCKDDVAPFNITFTLQ